MEQEPLKVSPASVAQALAADYFCIYYVNTDNDKFIEYSASEEYKELGLPSAGDDFISFSRKRFEEIIYPEDQERFLDGFIKEKVMSELDAHGIYMLTFRLMFKNVPTYVHLKVTRMIEKEGHHVVIGISSVDEQMKALEAFETAHHASITYSRIAQALTLDKIRPIYEFDVTCQGSVPQAFEALFESTGFEDAIRNAISIGGDSDTIAAIAGGMAEAYYGIPKAIMERALVFLDDDLLKILHEFEKKYERNMINHENCIHNQTDFI